MTTTSYLDPRIHVGDELKRVTASFEAYVAAMPGSLRNASVYLEERIGLRKDAGGSWGGRLSPVTILYPLLQCEGLAEVEIETARKATLAHFYLLVYAFVDDRRIDGQLEPDTSETAFACALFEEGMRLLEELPGYGARAGAVVDKLLSSYQSAQTYSYRHAQQDPGMPVLQPRILEVASGRAAYGAMAVMALASAAGVPVMTQRRLRNAFNIFVTALQWSDDLCDWKEDLERGEDNLLLNDAHARQIETAKPNGEPTPAGEVAEALIRHGVLGRAASQARRWYAAAAARQMLLGCPILAGLIEEKASRVDAACAKMTQIAAVDSTLHSLRLLGAKSLKVGEGHRP